MERLFPGIFGEGFTPAMFMVHRKARLVGGLIADSGN
jgi:hypothetical protein